MRQRLARAISIIEATIAEGGVGAFALVGPPDLVVASAKKAEDVSLGAL